MPQEDQRYRRATIHWLTHPQGAKRDEKISYGVDSLQKGIGYGLAKLDNKLSQNVQDIRRSQKLIEDTMKNWRLELTARGKSWAGVKVHSAITITIYDSDDATQSHI